MSAYVAELRKLSEYCQFGDTLSDMLRDLLVCVINDQKLQRRLLTEAALTYDRAFALAQALEAADKSAKELGKGLGIHTIRPQTHWQGATEKFNQQGRPCYRCGRTNHTSDACRFKESDCLHCGKKGHIAKVCRSRAKPDRRTQRGRQPGKLPQPKPTHHVTGEVTHDGSDDPMYMLFNVPSARSSPILVTVQLNEASLEMEVDTGATASLISDSTLKSLWSDGNAPPLRPTDVKLRTYTGEELKVLGSLDVTVRYGAQKEEMSLLVVPGTGPSLLGRDWLKRIRLDWQALNQVQSTGTSLQSILRQHDTVFRDELGRVKDATAKVYVNPDAPPTFYKA